MKDIAWVTCQRCKDLTTTEQLVVVLLSAHGPSVEPVVWDDPRVNWNAYRRIIIRSVWDYHLKIQHFLSWLTMLKQDNLYVCNPVDVLIWNHHKFYLEGMSKKGVPIIPSRFLRRGGVSELYQAIHETSWEVIVIKPAVSATAFDLLKIHRSKLENHSQAIDLLINKHDVILQEFKPEIYQDGEWSFIYFNRQFSHAVIKQPREGDFRVQSDFGGSLDLVQPSDNFLMQVEAIVNTFEEDLLYCRVDGIILKGQFVLMEIELIEPELFLINSETRKNFAEAIQFLL